MMLRISAGLAILVGLVLAIETYAGMSKAYGYSLEGEGTYVAEHFALQWTFVAALIVGGGLAFWREWSTLLAAAWGIVVGLDAPHLIHPPIPAAVLSRLAAGAHVASADIGQLVAVGIAVLGLVLCGISEWQRQTSIT